MINYGFLTHFNIFISKDEGSPCSLNHLINSHFALLKVVNEANDNFGMLIGSYFATQVSFAVLGTISREFWGTISGTISRANSWKISREISGTIWCTIF